MQALSRVFNRRVRGGGIAKAYSTSLLGVFSGLFSNLILLRAIVLEVDVPDFATYALAMQLTAYLSILQLGLDFAASREIAAKLGSDDPRGANQAFWELHRFNRRMTFLAGVLVVTVSTGLWVYANHHTATLPNGKLLAGIIFINGVAQIIQALARPYVAALTGTRRQATVNITQTANSLATAGLAYVLLKVGLGVYCLPVAAVIIWGVSFGVFRNLVDRHAPWRAPHPAPPNTDAFRQIFRFGGLSSLGGVAWTIESTSDVIILGLAGNPALVAAYVVWWRMPQMFFDLCTRLAFSAFPELAHRQGRGASEANALFKKVGVISLFLGTLACVGISLWLPSFVHLWLGGLHQLQDGALVAALMGILVLLRVVANFLALFCFSQNILKTPVISSIIQAIAKVGLALVLADLAGLPGVLFASVLASLIPVLLIGSHLIKNQVLQRKDGLTFLSLMALTTLVPVLLHGTLAEVGAMGFVLGCLVTAAIWGIAFFIFKMKTGIKFREADKFSA